MQEKYRDILLIVVIAVFVGVFSITDYMRDGDLQGAISEWVSIVGPVTICLYLTRTGGRFGSPKVEEQVS